MIRKLMTCFFILNFGIFPTNADAGILSGKPQAEAAKIEALYQDWIAAVETGNIELYLSVLSDDIELVPTDAPALRTNRDYGDFLKTVFVNDSFKINQIGTREIVFSGNLAYARYDYEIIRTSKIDNKTYPSERNFLDILKKDQKGDWKVVKHIWNYTKPGVIP